MACSEGSGSGGSKGSLNTGASSGGGSGGSGSGGSGSSTALAIEVCSGLMNSDTNLGSNIAAVSEVFNEKTASIFLDRI